MNRFPFFTYFSAAEAYRSILQSLLANPSEHEVRGEKMYSEILGSTILIESADTLDIRIPERKQNKPYTYCESLWDMCGSTESKILSAFQPGITRFISDQDQQEEVIWGYGKTVGRELPRLARMLKEDHNTRRAVFVMPRNSDKKGTPPCLVSMQFIVRDNRLNGYVTMRSNDAWLGFPLDVFQFGLMLHTVAGYVGIPVGTYTHHVGSLHLYARDYQGAHRVVTSDRISSDEWTQIPAIPAHGILDIDKGYLYNDLVSVCAGKQYRESSAFKHYLDIMKKYRDERLSSKG